MYRRTIMKKISIEQLTEKNNVGQGGSPEKTPFPTFIEIRHIHQFAHQLRSYAVTDLWRKMTGFMSSQWSQHKERSLRRKTVAELTKLNSFMLKDIGITRADIDRLRFGHTTVTQLNNKRFKKPENRDSLNNELDLKVCQCNARVMSQSLAKNQTLSRCG